MCWNGGYPTLEVVRGYATCVSVDKDTGERLSGPHGVLITARLAGHSLNLSKLIEFWRPFVHGTCMFPDPDEFGCQRVFMDDFDRRTFWPVDEVRRCRINASTALYYVPGTEFWVVEMMDPEREGSVGFVTSEDIGVVGDPFVCVLARACVEDDESWPARALSYGAPLQALVNTLYSIVDRKEKRYA